MVAAVDDAAEDEPEEAECAGENEDGDIAEAHEQGDGRSRKKPPAHDGLEEELLVAKALQGSGFVGGVGHAQEEKSGNGNAGGLSEIADATLKPMFGDDTGRDNK